LMDMRDIGDGPVTEDKDEYVILFDVHGSM
jgi:hypothetical protein